MLEEFIKLSDGFSRPLVEHMKCAMLSVTAVHTYTQYGIRQKNGNLLLS